MTVWDDASRWYRLQEPAERVSWRAALRRALPASGDVVVDVGCGPGTALRAMRQVGLRVPHRWVGLDASASMLRRARTAGATVVGADVTRLPLADATADLVVAGWLLHVLDPGNRGTCLREIARVLRPGGRCVVVVPAPASTWLGCATRTVSSGLAGGSGAMNVPVDLDEHVAAAGLVVRSDVVTRGGYTARVLLLGRPLTAT